MTKSLEGMQGALEQESKGKAEGLRMKKKLESDVGELEIALEHSNANNLETQSPLRNISSKSVKLPANWKRNKEQKRWQGMRILLLKEKLMLCKMLWKKPELYWNKLIETVELLNKNCLMLMRLFLMQQLQT